eukprot:8695871-Pyramimonas_sp.AAC.1
MSTYKRAEDAKREARRDELFNMSGNGSIPGEKPNESAVVAVGDDIAEIISKLKTVDTSLKEHASLWQDLRDAPQGQDEDSKMSESIRVSAMETLL